MPAATDAPVASASGSLSSIPVKVIRISQPAELAVAGPNLWALAGTGLARIDIATNLVQPLDLGTEGDTLDNLAATPTAVWVADFDGSEVLKVDPATGRVVARIAVGAAEDVLPVGGTIWVTNHHEGSVARIDAQAATVIDTVTVGSAGPSGPQQLAEGAGSVWVDEPNTNQVIRMDPSTGKVVASIDVSNASTGSFGDCGGILATAAAVWVTGCHDSADIVRIDPATNKVVASVALDAYAQDPVVIDGKVWVAVGGLGSTSELDRIDPATNRIDRRVPVSALTDVGGSAIAGGDYWVSNSADVILRFPLSELTVP